MRFKLKIIFYLIWFKLLKWMYGHNLRALRKRRFYRLLEDLNKSPFYASFSSKKSLQGFPVMDKTSFMSNFDQINTCGITLKNAMHVAVKAERQRDFSPTIKGITVGLSSGTSGNRGVFLASENERAQWVALVLDRVIGFSFRKRKVAFFLRANSNLYESVNSKFLSFRFFDLLKPIPEQVEMLDLFKPDILVGQPSLLMELSNAVLEGNLSLSLTKVISVAEVLSPEDKDRLEKVFDQTIHQVYQCTEGFLAATCKEGRLHFNEDFLVIEKKYLDTERKRFYPIITDLLRRSQPIIRYELNDIITEHENCPCGSKMTAIEMIEGRADDILKFMDDSGTEVKIFPDFFRKAIMLSDPEIEDYSLIQKEKKLLQLFVKSLNSTSFSSAQKSIIELLSNHRISDIKIVAIAAKDHIKGNKLRRIRNDAN